jgi:hypothetical protein
MDTLGAYNPPEPRMFSASTRTFPTLLAVLSVLLALC